MLTLISYILAFYFVQNNFNLGSCPFCCCSQSQEKRPKRVPVDQMLTGNALAHMVASLLKNSCLMPWSHWKQTFRLKLHRYKNCRDRWNHNVNVLWAVINLAEKFILMLRIVVWTAQVNLYLSTYCNSLQSLAFISSVFSEKMKRWVDFHYFQTRLPPLHCPRLDFNLLSLL